MPNNARQAPPSNFPVPPIKWVQQPNTHQTTQVYTNKSYQVIIIFSFLVKCLGFFCLLQKQGNYNKGPKDFGNNVPNQWRSAQKDSDHTPRGANGGYAPPFVPLQAIKRQASKGQNNTNRSTNVNVPEEAQRKESKVTSGAIHDELKKVSCMESKNPLPYFSEKKSLLQNLIIDRKDW